MASERLYFVCRLRELREGKVQVTLILSVVHLIVANRAILDKYFWHCSAWNRLFWSTPFDLYALHVNWPASFLRGRRFLIWFENFCNFECTVVLIRLICLPRLYRIYVKFNCELCQTLRAPSDNVLTTRPLNIFEYKKKRCLANKIGDGNMRDCRFTKPRAFR